MKGLLVLRGQTALKAGIWPQSVSLQKESAPSLLYTYDGIYVTVIVSYTVYEGIGSGEILLLAKMQMLLEHVEKGTVTAVLVVDVIGLHGAPTGLR